MLKIGITGGIGSGKSTICKIFELYGVPIYYADSKAKELMTSNPELIFNIKKVLGEQSYNSDNSLNKPYIASLIFNDKNKLNKINNLVHPAVKYDFDKWSKGFNVPYLLKEAALLFEAGSYKDLDYNILVSAPLDIRILRVIKRDNITEESVLSRVKNQMDESDKIKLADYNIDNSGKQSLIQQVSNLNQIFKEIAYRNEEI